MKVLHLDEQRTWRGGEQQASWLVQGLAARGHECHIAGRPDTPWLLSAHGGASLERLALPLRGEWDLHSALRLAQYARKHQIDLFHAHTSHAHTMAIAAARIAGRGRVVAHRRVSFAPHDNVLTRWKYRHADRLVCVSRAVAEVLGARGYGAPQVVTIHSAVDLERLEPARRARIAPEAPVLLSAGALVPHKDHATLIEAFARVRESVPGATLLIAGEGELRAELMAHIERLRLDDAVRLLGHRDDVPQLLAGATLYVSSSWSEGLGTSVLEALACEVPVVATVAGGVGEMVLDGETGRLVPNRDPELLANAMLESLRHPQESADMAKAGRCHVEQHFSVETMVARTEQLYLDLVRPLPYAQS